MWSEERRSEFSNLGYNPRRPFFPHEIRYLPKAGPDALRLAEWMLRLRDPDRLWQIVVHGCGAALLDLPEELFMDDD
jgi:hypothetical protein